MTVLSDLEILTGSTDEASHVSDALVAAGDDLEMTYEILAGVAQRADVGLVRSLALIMKYEAEREAADPRDAGGVRRSVPLSNNLRELYAAFAAVTAGGLGSVDFVDLDLLLSEMALLGLHQVSTDSAALSYVADRWLDVANEIERVDRGTAKRYRELKGAWFALNERLRALCDTRRDIKERSARAQCEFLAIFSEDYLAERAALSRLQVAQSRLELLRENPGATPTMLEDLVAGKADQDGERLEAHQMATTFGFRLMTPTETADTGSDLDDARSLLRRIAMLTHPDRVRQLDLSWFQNEQLSAIWHETNKLRALKDNAARLSNAIPFLEEQLQLVERIIELAHIDELDAALTIQGTSLTEQMDWLREANDRLAKHVASMQVKVYLMNGHPDTRYFEAMVSAPEELQKQEREVLRLNTEQFHRESASLERAAEKLQAEYT